MNSLTPFLRRLLPPGIRVQIMCWYTAVFAVLLLVTGAVFYQYLERSLEASLDTTLQVRAQELAGSFVAHQQTITIANTAGELPGFQTSATDAPVSLGDVNYGTLVRLVDIHGNTLRETPAFYSLRVPAESVTQPLHAIPWQGTVLTTSDQEVRLYSRALIAQGKIFAVLQVGQSLEQMHTLLHTLVGVLLAVGFLVLLLCALSSYWLAKRAFAPIRHLAQTARRIQAGDLQQRVRVPQARDEVQYLAQTLNDMISSLDQAFTRQRRFVADASHELRTPVAVIRNKADVTLLNPRTPQVYCAVLQDIHTETERLSHLISDLLALARGDEGQARLERESVRLDLLVASVAANAEGLAKERGITLSVQAPRPVTMRGDEARLIQVIMNLLDNAIRYTNPGGQVQVSVESTLSKAQLVVRDTGVGIAPEHLPHLFERFYRADQARTHTGDSRTGLGLSIVDWIVRMHDGSVSVRSQIGRGSSFTVTLPLLPPAQEAGVTSSRSALAP